MKQLLTVLVIFSITSVLFIACNDKTSESGTNTATEEMAKPFDLAAAKKSIDEANASFGDLVKKGDSVGIANLYASDAKVLGANMPAASGRAAIQSAYSGMLGMGIGGATLTSTEVWGTEALVSEEGTYSLSDKSGKEIDKGKYIDLWKMEDGKWKIHRDIFNSDNPPAPTH